MTTRSYQHKQIELKIRKNALNLGHWSETHSHAIYFLKYSACKIDSKAYMQMLESIHRTFLFYYFNI